jgi:hypothetical protein
VSPPWSPAGPMWRKTPVSRAFLYISFRVPNKGAPLSRFPLQSYHRDAFPETPFVL